MTTKLQKLQTQWAADDKIERSYRREVKTFAISLTGIALGFCLATCNPLVIGIAAILFTFAVTF